MAESSSIWVSGFNISSERVNEVARQYGWQVAVPPQDANAVVVGEIDGGQLAQILSAPIFICIEDRVAGALAFGQGLLTVTISAELAYKVGMAGVLVDVFTHRGWVHSSSRSDLLLVMHEALSNAIIHGDLEMDSLNQNSSAAFLEFAATLENRLSEPAYGGRAVQISAQPDGDILEICVWDQGKGFTQHDVERSVLGRGLSLIRARSDGLDHQEGGRKTVISFNRREKC